VLFSEDPALEEERKAGDFAAEFRQATIADAVVLIPETEGPLVEAALYQDELIGKCIVFTTRRDAPGFARAAYQLLVTHEVEPEEWRVCERVRRLAREFVEALRARQYAPTTTSRLPRLGSVNLGCNGSPPRSAHPPLYVPDFLGTRPPMYSRMTFHSNFLMSCGSFSSSRHRSIITGRRFCGSSWTSLVIVNAPRPEKVPEAACSQARSPLAHS